MDCHACQEPPPSVVPARGRRGQESLKESTRQRGTDANCGFAASSELPFMLDVMVGFAREEPGATRTICFDGEVDSSGHDKLQWQGIRKGRDDDVSRHVAPPSKLRRIGDRRPRGLTVLSSTSMALEPTLADVAEAPAACRLESGLPVGSAGDTSRTSRGVTDTSPELSEIYNSSVVNLSADSESTTAVSTVAAELGQRLIQQLCESTASMNDAGKAGILDQLLKALGRETSSGTVLQGASFDQTFQTPAIASCTTPTISPGLSTIAGLFTAPSCDDAVVARTRHDSVEDLTGPGKPCAQGQTDVLLETPSDGELSEDTMAAVLLSLPMAPDFPVPSNWEPCVFCASGCDPKGAHSHGEDCDGTDSNTCEHTGRCLYDDNFVPQCHLVSVQRETAEWYETAGACIAEGWDVRAVTRVQNPGLLRRFEEERRADFALPYHTTVRNDLYHVSRAPDLDTLLLEGLDQRLSNAGRFGRGVYFSDRVDKSNSYWRVARSTGCGWVGSNGASPGDPTEEVRTMLKCRARLGRAKVFDPGFCDSSLRREPRGFDSVEGNLTGQDEFIVYSNDRAIIEYVIEYVVPKAKVDDGARIVGLLSKCCSTTKSTSTLQNVSAPKSQTTSFRKASERRNHTKKSGNFARRSVAKSQLYAHTLASLEPSLTRHKPK